MKKLKITKVKSVIDRPERQKRTMEALGLRKLHATVELEATPQILGMVRKVNHLVKVEEIYAIPVSLNQFIQYEWSQGTALSKNFEI